MRTILREAGLKIAELAASAALSLWFTAMVGSAALPGTEWILGVIIFLIFQVIEVIVRTSLMHKEHQDMLSCLAAALVEDSASQTLLHVAMSYAERCLTAAEAGEAWRKLSWFAQRKYVATNYIQPESFYKTREAEDVVNLQKAKMRADTDFAIKKVLIWSDADERSSEVASDIVHLHHDENGRMLIREIIRKDINAALEHELETILKGRIDFAVFDEKVVLIWYLDKNRRVQRGRVVVSAEERRNFVKFFDKLFIASEPTKYLCSKCVEEFEDNERTPNKSGRGETAGQTGEERDHAASAAAAGHD